MGILVTYGSYMPKSQNIIATSAQVTILDTIVAILSGIAIFPAVFAMGVEPTEGPKLVFVILPTVFDQMSFGTFWGALFFLLISLAAITSVLSLLEATISYVTDHWRIARKKAILILSILLMILTTLCSLSITGRFDILCPMGINLFDILDALTSKIMMPICALAILFLVGWFQPRENTISELQSHSRIQGAWFYTTYFFLVRWVLPVVILLIFLNGFGVI